MRLGRHIRFGFMGALGSLAVAIAIATAVFFSNLPGDPKPASAQSVSIGCGYSAGCTIYNVAPYGHSVLYVQGYQNGWPVAVVTWQYCPISYGCYLSTVIPGVAGRTYTSAYSPGQIVWTNCHPPVGGGGGGSW